MTDLRKAAEQALEILDMCFYDEEDEVYCLGGWHQEKFMDAREALRQALAQPEQEPVAFLHISPNYKSQFTLLKPKRQDHNCKLNETFETVPVYTAPPRREWVGLSDDEREHFRKLGFVGVLAVENTLKEKNNG